MAGRSRCSAAAITSRTGWWRSAWTSSAQCIGCILAALGGAVAMTLQRTEVGFAAILIALYLILLAWLAIVLGHVEAHATEADRGTPPLVSEVQYRNRVYEELLDLALIALAYYAAFRFRFPTHVRRVPPAVRDLLSTGHRLPDRRPRDRRQIPTRLAQRRRAGAAPAGQGSAWGCRLGPVDAGDLPVRAFLGSCSRSMPACCCSCRRARLAATSVDEHLRNRRGRGRPVLIYGAGVGGALLVRGSSRTRRSASIRLAS
jgi:hypothetical protein